MAANRILYLGVLVLCAVFYFASGIWFSWVLLVLIIALPVLSFLLSLPAMLSCRFSAQSPDTVEAGEKAALRLRLTSWRFLPLPETHIRLNLRTRDREKDLRFLSHLSRTDGILSLSTGICGYLAPEFCRGWVYDALGLFRMPVRMPKLSPTAILPKKLQPDPMPPLEQFLQPQLKAKLGGGYSEIHDHRAYRPGDPVKDIHWKLSLKTDTLIVREPLEPIRRNVILALRTPHGQEERVLALGNLRYLSEWLLEHSIPHEVVWMNDTRLKQAVIRNEIEEREMLRAVCLVSDSSAELPWPLPMQADGIYPIGPQRTAAPEGRAEP